MSKDELLNMADELQAADMEQDQADQAEHQAEVEALAEPTVAVDSQGLQMIAFQGVGAIGGITCRMANVSPLEGEEVEALAGCLVALAEVYDFGNMNPKTAAWFSLGVVGVAVIAGRKKLPPPEPANDNQVEEVAPPPVEEPKGYGDGDNPSPPPPSEPKKKPATRRAKRAPGKTR